MSSNNLSLTDEDSLNISSEILSDKETQTSYAYITDSFNLVKGPSRPLPKGIDKSQVEPTVHNILDCRILKDLSDSKSTELNTESFIKDIENSNPSESIDEGSRSPTSPRYCQEIAKPYLNTHLKDCEDSVESLEKLIQDALEDYPCYKFNQEQNEIQDKINETTTNVMETTPNEINNQNESREETNTDSKNDPEKSNDNSEPKSPPIQINNIKSDSKNKVLISKNNRSEINMDEEINFSSISMESISKCTKESLTAMKQSASSCLNKVEIVIGIKKPENPEEKPSYYAMEKPREDVNPSHNIQTEVGSSLKNIFNNSCDKICTFKDACKGFAANLMNNNAKISAVKETCKDFAENLLNIPDDKLRTVKETCKNYADKLYNTSKNAITLLSNESTRILTKSNTELSNNSDLNANEHKQKEMKIRNISTESITSFLFKKAENKPVNNDPPSEKAITGTSKIMDTIPPDEKLSFDKVKKDIVSSKFEKSSPYDVPLPKDTTTKPPDPPETRIPTVSAIDHSPEPPAPPNMFAMITSKIFSIFSNESELSAEPIIQENEDDEEEDPFEKFMEQ